MMEMLLLQVNCPVNADARGSASQCMNSFARAGYRER